MDGGEVEAGGGEMELEADVETKRVRWKGRRDSAKTEDVLPKASEVEEQQERWRRVAELEREEELLDLHRTNSMAHANALQHRGGLDFNALARGGERSYSTSYLVNLDPDLLTLCAKEGETAYDLSLSALAGHTKRIFKMITTKSKRDINQFCFGSTYVQLNPNYRKFDRMDPMTWKKEGISSSWTGMRGYRKRCCKVCCTDVTCSGCNVCKGCINSPIRGNYDGLVVLTAVTRETLPNISTIVTGHTQAARKNQERHLDHENFSVTLESMLTAHFMYGGDQPELQIKCVPSNRTSIMMGDSIDDGKLKQKRFTSYVVYVAYRLETGYSINHTAKLSRAASNSHAPGAQPLAVLPEDGDGEDDIHRSRDSSASFKMGMTREGSGTNGLGGYGGGTGAYDIEDIDDYEYGVDDGPGFGLNSGPMDEEDEKMLEDLEDKQLRERIGNLESENSNMKEQVWKLEHGRTWVENRLTALESDLAALKTGGGGVGMILRASPSPTPTTAKADTPATESEEVQQGNPDPPP